MDFTHETPFTASSLRQALQMAEFSNVRVYPTGPVPHGLKGALRVVLWKALSLGIRFIGDVEDGPKNQKTPIYTVNVQAVAESMRLKTATSGLKDDYSVSGLETKIEPSRQIISFSLYISCPRGSACFRESIPSCSRHLTQKTANSPRCTEKAPTY
jgi:hypothetical protein